MEQEIIATTSISIELEKRNIFTSQNLKKDCCKRHSISNLFEVFRVKSDMIKMQSERVN